MVSEAHCMSFPCTELLLFNYAKVKTIFHSMAPLKKHHMTPLIAACVQIHTCFITVSVTLLCSLFVLELMVKLKTLLTVFIFILKAEARDYGKGRYISDACLWCSANHIAQGQLANQSRLCLSVGGTL